MGNDNIENAELMNTDSGNYVVLANDLIKGRTALSLNASKLLRTAIMQIKPDDEELKLLKISVDDFGEMIGTSGDSLYRDIKKTCKEIMSKPIEIMDRTNPKEDWKIISWCSYCQKRKGYIYIQLNNDLKPYLIGLKKLYTQYQLDNILRFKSSYSIKVYELIKLGLHNITILKPAQIIPVEITLDSLRIATGTEKAYPNISDFKKRVIKPAVKDIDSIPFGMRIDHVEDIKKGKHIVGFTFYVTSWTAQNPLPPEKQKQIDDFKARMKEKERRKKEQIKGQYDIEDYNEIFKLRGED